MNHLVWFRNDLRTIDNTSLTKACKTDNVVGVYSFDPRLFENNKYGFVTTGKFRAQFLIETVANLREQLQKLNIPLLVFFDTPENVIPTLIKEHNIQSIFLQKEWTKDEVRINEAIQEQLPDAVSFIESYDQFLFHPEDIPFGDVQKTPKVFTEFRKKCEKYSSIQPALPTPQPLINNVFIKEIHPLASAQYIPTLKELGLASFDIDPRTAFPFKGGETSGWQRINDYFWETQNLAQYKQTRNGLVGTEYSSKFSAWLANGSLSARSIYWEVKKFEKEIKKNQDTYWMIFELIWRDYFKYISQKHGGLIFKIGGILQKEYDWGTSDKKRQQWIAGNTPYPFVNANMKELAATGWMSNRGRQNVASFWAKEWQQDWRVGAAYFESMLIDYDVHSNWGNWMYNAGVGNDPRDRKFNIERQATMYDPDNTFVELWN